MNGAHPCVACGALPSRGQRQWPVQARSTAFPGWPAPRPSDFVVANLAVGYRLPSADQRLREFARLEGLQVFQLLAHADEVNGDGFFARDGAQHAALGGAVELGHDQAGELRRLVEGLDLRQRVLPGVAVDHQQHLVRGGDVGLGHHAADLGQLLHQVLLRWQAAGGVDQHHVLAARAAGAHGVEAHGRRVGALLADDLDLVAVGPHGQLLARRGAEGVGRRQQHAGASVGEMLGQLADAGGLAGAVDAGHHDHGGVVHAHHQRLFQRRQHVRDGVLQQGLDLCRVGGARFLHAAAQVIQQELGRRHAGIGHQQRGFQVFVQRLVDLRAGEDGGDAAPGALQPGLQPVHPAHARGLRGGGGGHQFKVFFGDGGHQIGGGSCGFDSGWRRAGRGRRHRGRHRVGDGWRRLGCRCRRLRLCHRRRDGRRTTAEPARHEAAVRCWRRRRFIRCCAGCFIRGRGGQRLALQVVQRQRGRVEGRGVGGGFSRGRCLVGRRLGFLAAEEAEHWG